MGRLPCTRGVWASDVVPVVAFLLDRGADIQSRNHEGDTPLHTTVSLNGHTAIVELLLDRGADIETRNDGGETPLHAAVGNYSWRSSAAALDRAVALLDGGADMEARDDRGDTPLHKAVIASFIYRGEPPGLIEFLLDRGADLEARNDAGNTPLHKAVLFDVDRSNIYGAEPVVFAYGVPPGIAYNGGAATVELLLDLGADINARNPAGETPCQVWERYQAPASEVGDRLCGG